MADVHSPEIRSKNMVAIKGRNTRPELAVRQRLHRAGFRYRLHVKELPGKPDLVFPGLRAVLFINGCFWHLHRCHLFKWPGTRREFWEKKISGNAENDCKKLAQLRECGWRTGIVWECALKGKTRLAEETVTGLIAGWLASDRETLEITGNSA